MKRPLEFSKAEWRMIRSYLRYGRKHFRVLRAAETTLKDGVRNPGGRDAGGDHD